MRLKFPLLIVLSLLFTSCGSTYLYFKNDNKVNTALTGGNTPTKAAQTNVNIDLGSWRLDALTASPDAEYLALGSIKLAPAERDIRGKLEIYRQFGGVLKRTFSNSDLKTMIESNTEIDYPSQVYAFHPFKLGYENDTTLIVIIQPQTIGDSTPQNVEMKINLKNEQVVGIPVFFDRSEDRVFPSHPSKNRYNFEVINGEMHVNGTKLMGLPSNIDKRLHDEVTLK